MAEVTTAGQVGTAAEALVVPRTVLVGVLAVIIAGCGGEPQPAAMDLIGVTPELTAMCQWIDSMSRSKLVGEIAEANLAEIAVQAEDLAAEGRNVFMIIDSGAQPAVAAVADVLHAIGLQARTDRALETVPALRGTLRLRVSALLDAARTAYGIPEDDAPCVEQPPRR